MSKFTSAKRLPGSRAAGRAAVREAMSRPPSQRSERSVNVESQRAPETVTPPPLLRKLSSASSAVVARALATITGTEIEPSPGVLAAVAAECAARLPEAGRKSSTLVEEVKRNEVTRLRAEATQLQRELHDVEVRELKLENDRLKAENARLRESNREIAERARRSVEDALRNSAALWEEASAHLDRESSQPSQRGSAVSAASLDESSCVSMAIGCGPGDSLDVRLAHADAATPVHSISLLRQMADNNRRLKEQLAM